MGRCNLEEEVHEPVITGGLDDSELIAKKDDACVQSLLLSSLNFESIWL